MRAELLCICTMLWGVHDLILYWYTFTFLWSFLWTRSGTILWVSLQQFDGVCDCNEFFSFATDWGTYCQLGFSSVSTWKLRCPDSAWVGLEPFHLGLAQLEKLQLELITSSYRVFTLFEIRNILGASNIFLKSRFICTKYE